jgi:ATP-dependent Clp protease ATP-binding subunit ClpC
VFERFTEPARQVVVLAQEEAQGLRHGYIDTEHLLLGVLREEEGLGARVLESLNITLDGVRAEVARVVGEGEAAPALHLPFRPGAKHVLEFALREALTLGHNYIGTEHILLGLVRESDGVAVGILLDLGTKTDAVRNAVLERLGHSRRPPPTRQYPAWQYRLEQMPADDLTAKLERFNLLGRKGWEFVGDSGGDAVFRRLLD